MLTDGSDPQLLESAANEGVLLMLDLDRQDWSVQLRNVARSPAVGIVVVPASAPLQQCRQLAPNLLIAKRYSAESTTVELDQVDVLFCELNEATTTSHLGCDLKPVLGYRPVPDLRDLTSARAACDVLQRDLAPDYDLSGYLV